MKQAAVSISAVILAAVTAFAGARADDAKPATPCSLDPGPVRTVTRVVDGETLALDDGSVVRLIGALAPRARDAGAAAGAWQPENDAIKALNDLVAGRKVKLAYGGRRTDRYGHILAHVFLENGDWVQGALLDGGHARAYGLPESFACAAELLIHEDAARRRRIGLWDNSVYQPVSAKRPEWLLRLRGKYERVIGNVFAIGRTKSATYLNFGSDYKTDFTARIGKAFLAANPDFKNTLDSLQGKTIVVRGWIERNNGPLVDIDDPSQIQTLDTGDDAVAANAQTRQAPDAAGESPMPPPASDASKHVRPAPAEGPEPGGLNL